MRKGSKNTKIATSSKTRRCVVLVQRMKPQPNKNTRRTVAATPEPTSVKKRPGPASSTSATRLSSSSLSTSFKAKDRVKTPIVAKNAKVVQELKKISTPVPVVEELPPTVAAGRSRRTHKPNPKYANDDLLTPKSLKPSAISNFDDNFNKTANDSENEGSRKAKALKISKPQIEIDSDSDYEENNDDSDSSQFGRTTRSRPAKTAAEPVQRRSTAGVVNTSAINRTTTNAKSTPTQLQQLRRTLNASNISPLAMGKKRKLEESSPNTTPTVATKRPNTTASTPVAIAKTPILAAKKPLNAASTPNVAAKKPIIAASTPVVGAKKPNTSASTPIVANRRPNLSTSTQKFPENNAILKRRQLPGSASSENKTKTNVTTAGRLPHDRKPSMLSIDKRPSPLTLTRSASVANLKSMTSSKTQQSPLQRDFASRSSLNKASSTSTPSLSKSNIGQSPNSTPPSTTATASKTRSSLGKTVPLNKQQQKAAISADSKKAADGYNSSDVEETPTITIDDFETMPTFTIVNINDIINKKGDVLISEASEKNKAKSVTTTKPEPTRNVQKQQTPTQSQPSKSQTQSNKLQPQQSKQPPKKQSTEGGKTQSSQPFSTSTPLVKKPVEKIENNTSNKITDRKLSSTAKPSPPTQKNTTQPPATRPTTRSGTSNVSEKKPAPRILNSVVSPRTKPIKPVINNLDVSDDDPSGSLSLYTDEDEDEEENIDEDEDELDDSRFINTSLLDSDSDLSGNESEIIDSPKKLIKPKRSSASVASNKSKISTPPNAAKENSAAANNRLPKKQAPQAKQSQPAARKLSPEKVVVQREGNKIIKKITCFETWYVINIPADAPEQYERNTLDMPLIDLANCAKDIKLPSDIWATKVTLYEVRKSMKPSSYTIYTGDLTEQKIKESDRANYQPSCVMFRRTVPDRVKLQLPYDRAVIFKNKTFFTNIEGKNVKLVGAPTSIKEASEVETLLNIVDGLTLKSPFVEPAATIL